MFVLFIQGKGDVRTYWLLGEDKQRRISRLASVDDGEYIETVPTKSCLKPTLSDTSEKSEMDLNIFTNGPINGESARGHVTLVNESPVHSKADNITKDSVISDIICESTLSNESSLSYPPYNSIDSGEENAPYESQIGNQCNNLGPEVAPLIKKRSLNGKVRPKQTLSKHDIYPLDSLYMV